jgi:hypothetical protein
MAARTARLERTKRNRDQVPVGYGNIDSKSRPEEASNFGQKANSSSATSCVDSDIPNLTALPSLSRAALTTLWTRLFDRPVPKGLSPQLMVRFLAFEIQVRASNGLPYRFAEQLAERAGAAQAVPKVSARLRPGGRLLREWNGITHVVDVEDGGFFWSGRWYASLSAIAKEITGAHWSGPRFFGLTGGTVAMGTETAKSSRTAAGKAGKAGRTANAGVQTPALKRSFKRTSKSASAISGGPA